MTDELSAYMEEFIGKNVSVVAHSNPILVGKEGTVIAETKRMLHVFGSSRFSIPKHTGKFKFTMKDGTSIINGDFILMRPEERPKSQRRILKSIRTRGR